MLTSHFDSARRRSTLANRLDKRSRFHVTETPPILDMNFRKHQGKRRESIDDVMSDGLANLVFGARVVEHVVGDLECEPKLAAVITQCIALHRAEAAKQRTYLAAGGEQ